MIVETTIENVLVYPKDCIGCTKFKKDIMVTMIKLFDSIKGGESDFYDFFLTTEQAEKLHEELTVALAENKLK